MCWRSRPKPPRPPRAQGRRPVCRPGDRTRGKRPKSATRQSCAPSLRMGRIVLATLLAEALEVRACDYHALRTLAGLAPVTSGVASPDTWKRVKSAPVACEPQSTTKRALPPLFQKSSPHSARSSQAPPDELVREQALHSMQQYLPPYLQHWKCVVHTISRCRHLFR